MTDRIEFNDLEVSFIEETFGGLDTAEFTITNDELSDYEVRLDIEGTAPLDEFITGAGSGRYELSMSPFQTNTVEVREADSEIESDSIEVSTESFSQTRRSQMPPISHDGGLQTQADDTFYQRLVNNPDSQPAQYRRLIRNQGEIERTRLDRWASRQGFDKTSGSHNATLLMLERIDEIERRGRGDDQVIAWVGE